MTDQEIMAALAEIEEWALIHVEGGGLVFAQTDDLAQEYSPYPEVNPIAHWWDFGPLFEKYHMEIKKTGTEAFPLYEAVVRTVPDMRAYSRSDPNPRRAGCLAIIAAFGKGRRE